MSDQIGVGRHWYSYRLYDDEGSLVYSGSTSSPSRRIREHDPKLRAITRRVEVDMHEGRWRAALAERQAGRGRHGWLRGGIGAGMAATMSHAERVEALCHPAMSGADLRDMFHWGLTAVEARALLADAAANPIPSKRPTRLGSYTIREVLDGMAEATAARVVGLDRMTVRKALGK